MIGVINVYKEKDYSSHDVVAVVRRILGVRRVGHTGTLDPQAEGVLPICVGKATKLANFVMSENKIYLAQVILGQTTDTDDRWGKVLTSSAVNVSDDEILQAVNSFVGEYMQVPPMYSAIKINGERLYKMARKGETVERPPRKVQIFSIKITNFDQNVKGIFTVKVKCSKGTYIRSLCSDIGKKLGCGAFMGNLIRLQTGDFIAENAFRLSQIEKMAQAGEYAKFLIPVTQVLNVPQIVYCNKNVLNGAKIQQSEVGELPTADFFWICSEPNKPIGLYKLKNGFLCPEVMIYANNI
ncbi:MAG: tRNA pseudouridine(55) synthase TruB [Firmicutes bacterium]|nr:tRNA pseudouridine(55) synthase TruB [Bacillota bacterium]